MSRLHLTLLGGFQVRLGTGAPVILARKKAQALLAFLVIDAAETHLRDKLAALLWGDSSDQRARQSLRQTLLALKQALPGSAAGILRIDGEKVALNRQALEVDVAAFEAFASEGTPHALGQAAALYNGDFLEGLGVQEPRFEEWLIGQRERLRELAIEVLAKLLAHQTTTGALQEAVQTGARLLAIDPLQEVVHRALMRLYARQGRRGAALRQYQICAAVLQRELGVEPEEATKQLYQELLQAQPLPSAAPPAVEAGENLAHAAAEGTSEASVPAAPLVGRAPEMATLRRLRGRAWRGEARTAVIVGEAGIGKSRFVAAFVSDSVEHGGRALVGRAHETERILPFGPWVDAFRTTGVIPELARAPGLDAVWRVPLTRLFPELGEPGAARTTAAEEGHVRLFEAMAQAVGHLALRQPLLVVLEDLHWADEMSLRLLAFLSRRGVSWPALFVATLRQEEVIDAPAVTGLLRELAREPHFVSLLLAPLSAPDTVTLVRLLGRTGADEPAVQRLGTQIWQASEGNPFMVVETMRALYGTDAFAVPDLLPTPPRVRDIIAARLDRLSHRGRELAALASVIGREFDFALLENAAGADGRETAAAVEELVARHVLHVVNERLDFTHERIREVAYEHLLPPSRRLLHAAVANALERLYAHDLAPHYAALSLHCQEGALWDKAATYLRNAGATAALRGAHRAAVTCFEQALGVLQQLPEGRASLEQSIDVRFALRNSFAALGEYDPLSDHLEAAEAAAQTVGDRRRVGWVSAYRTNELFVRGENQAAIASGECARAIAAAVGDLRLQVTADLFLGQACHAVGEYRRGADLLRHSMAALEGERLRRAISPTHEIYTRVCLACCLAEIGAFREGLACTTQALRLADEVDRSYARAHASFGGGMVCLRKGDLARAVSLLERGFDSCRGREFPFLAAANESLLGYAYVLSDRLAQAVPLLEDAVESFAIRMHGAALPLVYLAECYLKADRRSDARAMVDRALALSVERGERGHQGWALRARGLIATQGKKADVEAAMACYHEALALGTELEMSPLRAQCHLALGQCHRRMGRHAEAHTAFLAAADLFRAMEMSHWLPRCETALRASAS